MRVVIMHQKKQKDFIQNIYSSYKSRMRMLIIQEPEGTIERKEKKC